jgi:hypothetical protein
MAPPIHADFPHSIECAPSRRIRSFRVPPRHPATNRIRSFQHIRIDRSMAAGLFDSAQRDVGDVLFTGGFDGG